MFDIWLSLAAGIKLPSQVTVGPEILSATDSTKQFLYSNNICAYISAQNTLGGGGTNVCSVVVSRKMKIKYEHSFGKYSSLSILESFNFVYLLKSQDKRDCNILPKMAFVSYR